VWGKRHRAVVAGVRDRFTPTRVGKTIVAPFLGHAETVHPHACGENLYIMQPSVNRRGSPPRVWGKHIRRVAFPLSSRFTPTRVGKTKFAARSQAVASVHPHACGENSPHPGPARSLDGSPPRVWGKLLLPFLERLESRFTPTRVGKTTDTDKAWTVDYGSPPRVWGKRRARFWWSACDRFTPTRVGKTS